MTLQFAALEIKSGEMGIAVLKAFMAKSVEQGVLFRTFELMGILTLGATKYLRFRSDTSKVFGILTERKVVVLEGASYVVKTFEGKILGKVPVSTMQMAGESGIHKEYRGPKIKYWERQFTNDKAKA